MKTVCFAGDGRIEMVEKPVPEARGNEVLVKVAYCGLCGSEKRIFRSGFQAFTPGHEISGTVEKCGPNAKQLKTGTPVIIYLSDYCQSCPACAEGNTSQCTAKKRLVGWHFNGGYAEYLVVPEHMVFPVGSLPLDIGVLALDTIGTAFHGLRFANPGASSSVLVIGCGPIGLGCLSILKNHYKIEKLYAADTSAFHLKLARELGVENTILVDPASTAESIVSALHEKVDHVIEVVGLDSTLAASLKAVRPNGKVILIGEPEKALTLQRDADWVLKDFSMVNTWYFPVSEIEENLRFMNDNIPEMKKIITHVLPIEQMEQAFELFQSSQTGKVLISMLESG